MFTGLIEVVADVLSFRDGVLRLVRPATFDDISIGSSIAVSGACLSVIKFSDTEMQFDVVEETLARTTLGSLKTGDRVNLERALRTGGRFEGHIVQGHIDCVGEILRFVNKGTMKCGNTLTIRYPKALQGFIVEKGSIAVDGVSLTCFDVTGDSFSVALIPETLEKTTLGNFFREEAFPAEIVGRSGVNLETDILGKYVRALSG